MGNKNYKVLFEGKILPGNDADEVRARLKNLFKADDKRMDRLFSGKAYAIRKPASEREARKYEKAINKAGAECRIASLDGSETLAPAHKNSSQQEIIVADSKRPAPVKQSRSFQLLGRMGRCRFLALCWLVLAIDVIAWLLPDYLPRLIGGSLTIQETVSMMLGIHSLALLLLIYICITRLHDMERNGWLWLFVIIPIVNVLFLLWLSFTRGSKLNNMYGTVPPSPNNFTRAIGLYLPLCLMLAAGAGAWLNQDMLIAYIQELPEAASDWAGLEYPL